VFNVTGVSNGSWTPQMGMDTSEEYWTFSALPSRFDTKVSVFIREKELLFVMEYNNAGAKWHTDEQSFALPHTPVPGDLTIEGYRTKTLKLKRPPPPDDVFFL